MKKLLSLVFVLVFVLPSLAPAQQTSAESGAIVPTASFVTPDAIFPFKFSATGVSPAFDNRKVGCTTWHMWYWEPTQFTTNSIQPEGAPDAGGSAGAFVVWPASQVLTQTLPLTANTFSQVTFTGFQPWVHVNLSATTGSGSIQGFVACWRGQGSSESSNNTALVNPVTSGSASVGITPVVSATTEGSHVLKASGGNLYSVYVTTGSTAGFLMVFNATSAPGDGAVTPRECVLAPANSTTSLNFGIGPPEVYATGITVVFSSTGCFTKTLSSTAFFHGFVQ